MSKREYPPSSGPSMTRVVSRRNAVGTLFSAGAVFLPSPAVSVSGTRRMIIDASSFGIVADGVTDDAPALIKAISALSTGSVLELPPGVLALGRAGWHGIMVHRLDGALIRGNATTLKWLALPTQSTTGFGPTGLRLYECDNVVVEGLSIDGNGVGCIGLGLDSCSHCVVRDVEAYAHGEPTPRSALGQFASAKGSHNRWHDCVARNATPGSQFRGYYLGNANSGCGELALRVDGCVARCNTATGFAIEAVGSQCVNCVSEDNAGAGFTSSTANGSPSSDHVFHGNVAQRNAFHGWQTDVFGPPASRITISGNLFANNGFSGIYCHKGTAIAVAGNVITGNGAQTASAAVSVTMSRSVNISNNIIEGDPIRGTCIGFRFAANEVSDVVVANNICRGSWSRTIDIDAADGSYSLRRIIVSQNVISGGSHGIHVGATDQQAVLDSITVSDNIVEQTARTGFSCADQVGERSTSVVMVGNTGNRAAARSEMRNCGERDNSWNAFRGEGPTAPTAGRWERGAIFFNSAPAPGAPIGWVCTATGLPGTWSRFGLIEP